MSYAQQVVNGITGDNVSSASLYLQPRTLIYGLSTFILDAIKVLAVQDASGRDLEPMPAIENLQWLDMRWPVAVADRPRGYCQVGADLIIIYPGVKTPQTLTVKYGNVIAPVTVVADSTSLPAEDDAAINSLTEALLLLKGRDLNAVQATVARFSKRIEDLKADKR